MTRWNQPIWLACMASLAKAERQRISARTKAGLARVRAAGKQLGRPALSAALRARIAEMAAEGASAYAIGKALRIDAKTVQKYRPPAPA